MTPAFEYREAPGTCEVHGPFRGTAVMLGEKQVQPPQCDQCREEERAAREEAKRRESKVTFVNRIGHCERHGEYTYSMAVVRGEDRWPDPGCTECRRTQEEEYRREMREVERRREIEVARRNSGVPLRFADSSFATFEVRSKGQRQARDVVTGFSDRVLRDWRSGGNLVLCGGVGTGKTHLATALANALLAEGVPVRYLTAFGLVGRVKSSWGRDSDGEEAVLEELERVPVLVIDEVGDGRGSDTERLFLSRVICDRYDQRRPTVIVSNLNREGLTAALGARAVDRLLDAESAVAVFDWLSYRQRRIAAATTQSAATSIVSASAGGRVQ